MSSRGFAARAQSVAARNARNPVVVGVERDREDRPVDAAWGYVLLRNERLRKDDLAESLMLLSRTAQPWNDKHLLKLYEIYRVLLTCDVVGAAFLVEKFCETDLPYSVAIAQALWTVPPY